MKKNKDKFNQALEQFNEAYPIGTIWQDDSSINDEEKVDFYCRTNDKWDFLGKGFPLKFYEKNEC